MYPVGIAFKGEGFYVTDYKGAGKEPTAPAPAAPEAPAAETPAPAPAASEAKTETAPAAAPKPAAPAE